MVSDEASAAGTASGRASESRVVVGARMVNAATAWVDSLDERQRAVAVMPGPDDPAAGAERLSWFYTPTDHGGLTFHQQSPSQQRLAMQLVSSGLSMAGYATVSTIIGLENVLDRVEGFSVTWGRERGRDPGLFYLRVFGDPSAPGTWAWRFGGHHVSLNFTLLGGRVVATTPNFLGANPAEVSLTGGGLLRPLGGPEDVARSLMASFSDAQLSMALLSGRAAPDIVTGNRARVGDGDAMPDRQDLWRQPSQKPRRSAGETRADHQADPAEHQTFAVTRRPKGLPAADMTESQRKLLCALIGSFHERLPDELAAEQAAIYARDAALDAVAFAWAGPSRRGEGHYFRLQGPRLLIEYDNTQNDANHAHSVLRDIEADFGLDVLADHRRAAHGR